MSKVPGDCLERCISNKCTIRESLSLSSSLPFIFTRLLTFSVAKNITETLHHHPLRDRTKAVSITSIVGVSLAFVALTLRLLARMTVGQWGNDDWIILAAMVCLPKSQISPLAYPYRVLWSRSPLWLLFVSQSLLLRDRHSSKVC